MKVKNVRSFSRRRGNVTYLINIQAGVKIDCFDTAKNANCATTSNHAASCNQANQQSSDVSRECFVSCTDKSSIEALTSLSNNDNENTLFDDNGISLDEELFCKTNYIYHLSSIYAKTKSLSKSKFLFMIHFVFKSLQKNFDKLHYHISNFDYQPDIIALTEAELHESKLYQILRLTDINSSKK